MKKHSKKVALILVLALTLVVAVPALAGTTTKISGKYEDPTIEVKIPTAGEAIINPFGLPVKIKADVAGGTNTYEIGEDCQIATRPLVGVNLSDTLALKIGATVIAETRGDFTLLSAKPASTSKEKEGFVYFEIANSASDLKFNGEKTEATVCNGFDIQAVTDELATWKGAGVFTGKGANNQIPVSEEAVTKTEMCTLAKATKTQAADGTYIITPAVNSYFKAGLFGEVVKVPDEEWRPTDGFNTTISWIIEPSK